MAVTNRALMEENMDLFTASLYYNMSSSILFLYYTYTYFTTCRPVHCFCVIPIPILHIMRLLVSAGEGGVGGEEDEEDTNHSTKRVKDTLQTSHIQQNTQQRPGSSVITVYHLFGAKIQGRETPPGLHHKNGCSCVCYFLFV